MLKHRIPLLTAVATLAAVIAIAALWAGHSPPATAQSTPAQVTATYGYTAGEVVVAWRPSSDTAYYRVGWVSLTELNAVVDAGQNWLDAFAFQDIFNAGAGEHTIRNLAPNTQYAFIVAGMPERFVARGYWSDWLYLTTRRTEAFPPSDYESPTVNLSQNHGPLGYELIIAARGLTPGHQAHAHILPQRFSDVDLASMVSAGGDQLARACSAVFIHGFALASDTVTSDRIAAFGVRVTTEDFEPGANYICVEPGLR